MTYRQIAFLKRELGLSTVELQNKFPAHRREISVIALCELSTRELLGLSMQDPDLYGEVMACRVILEED